jgi:hypothetical protein
MLPSNAIALTTFQNTFKWKNASTDGLPLDKQHVLVSVNGINHPADFDAGRNAFCLTDSPSELLYIGATLIYWREV